MFRTEIMQAGDVDHFIHGQVVLVLKAYLKQIIITTVTMNSSKNIHHYRNMGSKKRPGNRRKFLKQFYRKLIFKQKNKAGKNIPEDWIYVYLSRFLS